MSAYIPAVFPETVEELLRACERKLADPDAPEVVPMNGAIADLCRRLIALEAKP